MGSITMPMKNPMTLLCLLSGLLLLAACGAEEALSPENQVRATLASIEQAAEQRSMTDFMQFIADDYADHHGNDKKRIRGIMQLQFLRNQNINIFSRIRSIDIQDGTASVELSAAMAAVGVDLSLETNRLKANSHQFSLVLREHDGEWRVQSGSWQRGW